MKLRLMTIRQWKFQFCYGKCLKSKFPNNIFVVSWCLRTPIIGAFKKLLLIAFVRYWRHFLLNHCMNHLMNGIYHFYVSHFLWFNKINPRITGITLSEGEEARNLHFQRNSLYSLIWLQAWKTPKAESPGCMRTYK